MNNQNNIKFLFYLQGSNFIRCIKANRCQRSELFDDTFVKEQIFSTGTDILINQNEDNLWKSESILIYFVSFKEIHVSIIFSW